MAEFKWPEEITQEAQSYLKNVINLGTIVTVYRETTGEERPYEVIGVELSQGRFFFTARRWESERKPEAQER